MLTIEKKGADVVLVPNMLHVVMASNNDWVVPATADERRYLVLDVPDTVTGNTEYFDALNDEIDSGGIAAMLHELLAYDISKFKHRKVPSTDALDAQKALSMNSQQRWLVSVLRREYVYKSRHGVAWLNEWRTFHSGDMLYQSYLQYCTEIREHRPINEDALKKFVGTIYQVTRPRATHPIREIDNPHWTDSAEDQRRKGLFGDGGHCLQVSDRPRGYTFGEIDEARARFVEVTKLPIHWGSDGDDDHQGGDDHPGGGKKASEKTIAKAADEARAVAEKRDWQADPARPAAVTIDPEFLKGGLMHRIMSDIAAGRHQDPAAKPEGMSLQDAQPLYMPNRTIAAQIVEFDDVNEELIF
jgi:hypothetical protein